MGNRVSQPFRVNRGLIGDSLLLTAFCLELSQRILRRSFKMPASRRKTYKKHGKGYGRSKKRRKTMQNGYMRTSGVYGRFQPLGPELKWKDFDFSGSVGAQTGVLGVLNVGIQRGTGVNERIGAKLTITKINIKAEIGYQRDNTVVPDYTGAGLRLALILDKQCNGVETTVGNIYNLIGIGDPVNAFLNLAESKRYVVLKDWTWRPNVLSYDSMTNERERATKKIILNKKCMIPIQFSTTDTTGLQANVESNNILLVYMKSIDTAVTATMGINVRVRYLDL